MNKTQSRPSRLLNYSFNGLMLEMDVPLRRDEHIKVRLPERPSANALSCVEIRMGTVRWCSGTPQSFSGSYELDVKMPGLLQAETCDRRSWF